MNLINKHSPLTLSFCTALFCHVVLFSSLYHWSGKNSTETEQATLIKAVILSVTNIVTLPKTTINTSEDRPLTPQLRRISSTTTVIPNFSHKIPVKSLPTSRDPSHLLTQQYSFKKNSLEIKYYNHTQQAQDDSVVVTTPHKPDHQVYSKLLALLHTIIQEHQTYPLQAILAQQSGTAIVDFTLLPSGNIINSSLQQSSGYTELDEAAVEAVQAISPFKAIAINAKQKFDVAVSFALK